MVEGGETRKLPREWLLLVLLFAGATVDAGNRVDGPSTICRTATAVYVSDRGLRRLDAGGVRSGPLLTGSAPLAAHAPTCGQERVFLATRSGMHGYAETSGRSWTRGDLGAVLPAPLAQGTLYVAGRDGRLTALDPATGTTRWSRRLSPGLHPPAVVGDRLIVGGRERRLVALAGDDGRVRWSAELDQELALAPLARGDAVVAATYGPTVEAFDAGTGTVRWRRGLRSAPSLLAPLGADVLAGTFDGTLLVFDAQTGALRFRRHVAGRAEQPPLVQGGRWYQPLRVGRASGALLVLDPRHGEDRCTLPLPARPAGRPRSLAGRLLVPMHAGAHARRVHVLTPAEARCPGQRGSAGPVSSLDPIPDQRRSPS